MGCDVDGMKYIKRIFAVFIIFILGYLVLGEVFLKSDVVPGEYRCEKYTGKWYQIKADGKKEEIQIPGKYKAERNELMTVETVLPDNIPHNTYISFRSAKQEMNIYVDGVLRREYSTKDTRLFGKVSAVSYVFLELTPEDAGKTLTLKVQTDSSYSGMFYTVYYGNRIGVWNYFFHRYGVEIIVAFFALILGLVSIAAGFILRVYYHKEIVLEYLGWGVFIAAIWLISNSIFRQLISPNLSVINDMAFMALMVMPLPLTIYMNGIQQQRYEKIYRITCSIVIVDFVICTVLHVMHLVDYTDTIIYMAIADSFTIISMGVTIAIDIKKKYVKEYLWVSIGILASVIAAVIQMVMYFKRDTTFSGTILALGLILLLLFAMVNTIYEILQMEGERQRALLSSESKGKFLANMSHEIRTPINAVLGMNAMILRESKDRKIREYSMDIQNAGQSLLSIINDILDFSKIESGKMELIPAEYDFSSMIHDIVNMISMKAEAKELSLNLYVDEKLPSRLRGDDVRIRQILVNLLNNAVKYTEKGSVTLRVSGKVSEKSVILKFEIEDTGIGIKEEDIEKLFKEFERVDEERNRHVEGTGLGMSIVVQLLELMDSKLHVASVYGEGSRFFFEIGQEIINAEPIGNLEQRIHEQAEGYAYNVTFTAPKANILVVDDNAVNRKVFVNLLKETMVNIDEASGGMECLEKIREKRYDLIFLDHMMPEMDGIETLHHIKEEDDHFCVKTPVIALTANAVAGAREMYLSEGFDTFVSKPINPEKLEKLLVEMLPEDIVTYHKKKVSEDKQNEDEEFPQVDGIDWEYALLHTRDRAVLQATINDYYHLIDVEADNLENLYKQIVENQDAEECREITGEYRIKVHAMKSSAAMIGATVVSGLAKMLEYAARDEDINVIISVTPVFLKQWRAYKELLKPCIEEENPDDTDKMTLDYQMLNEYFKLLESAMEDMDIDTADEIMEQIRKFRYTEDEGKIIDMLGVAVTNIDSEQVTECVCKFRKYMEEMV